jgi:RND family efflux transporter MFP subunit
VKAVSGSQARLPRFVVGVAIAFSLAGFSPQDAPTPVSTAVVKSVMMSPTFAAPGSVVARNDAHIASEVEGKVVWVANVGDILKEGDPVARLDDDLLKLQVASDSATVDRLRATVRYDETQATRMERLAKTQAIAISIRDQAVSTRDQDKAQLAESVAELGKSKFQLEHGEIRAQFPGRVAARLINPGEYATVGAAIVRLVDIDDVEVSVPAPISASRYLKPGTSLTMEIEGKPVVGKLRATVPVGDINSRTVEVRITIASADGVVGDAARVLIPSAPARQVLAVPRDALVLREDNTYVFRVNGAGVVEHVAVEPGTEDGPLVEIAGDLKPGDRVVVRGAERLEVGQKVRVAP